jgi:hypothetical protein
MSSEEESDSELEVKVQTPKPIVSYEFCVTSVIANGRPPLPPPIWHFPNRGIRHPLRGQGATPIV